MTIERMYASLGFMLCSSLEVRQMRRVVRSDQGAVPLAVWRALQLERVDCGVTRTLPGVCNNRR